VLDHMSSNIAKLVIAGAVAVMCSTASAKTDPLSMRERSTNTTEASVIVNATPRQVYEQATNYRLWPVLFSDIRSVSVLGGTRDRARVKFRSRAIDREVTVDFDNVPDRVIKFVSVPSSRVGAASGEYILTPVDNGQRTRITARLFIKVAGPAKMFVTSSDTRAMRHKKLRADLTDLTAPRAVKHSRPIGGGSVSTRR